MVAVDGAVVLERERVGRDQIRDSSLKVRFVKKSTAPENYKFQERLPKRWTFPYLFLTIQIKKI